MQVYMAQQNLGRNASSPLLSPHKMKSHQLRRYLSTAAAAADTTAINPPIQPWPPELTLFRLRKLISCQKDASISLKIFRYAAANHPDITHTAPSYAAITARLSRAFLFSDVEALLQELRHRPENIKPPPSIFCRLIQAYGLGRRPNDAIRVFIQMPKFNCPWTLFSLNALLNALVFNEQFDRVHLFFKHSKRRFNVMPNLVTCDILVKGLCKKGGMSVALDVLDEMHGMGIQPNLVSYTTILDAYVKRKDIVGARKFFDVVIGKGYKPDTMMYTVLIDGYCRLGKLVDAVRVMDEMGENKVSLNEVTYGVVIEAYCREKMGGEVIKLLEDMLKNVHGERGVTCRVLCAKVVDVLCEDGRVDDACEVWNKCLAANMAPDAGILSTLIYWLCKNGTVREARRFFDEFEKNGLVPGLSTYNMLMEKLCEAGEMSEARRLWDYMVENRCKPNSFTFNLLVEGFCKRGNPKEAIRFFEEMLAKGCLPDESRSRILIEKLCGSGLDSETMKFSVVTQ